MALNDTFGLAELKVNFRNDLSEQLFPSRNSENRVLIGIGRDLSRGISRTESHFLFLNDIETATHALDRLVPWWRTMQPHRQRHLLSIIATDAGARLEDMLPAMLHMRDENWHAAAAHVLSSKWGKANPNRAQKITVKMKG